MSRFWGQNIEIVPFEGVKFSEQKFWFCPQCGSCEKGLKLYNDILFGEFYCLLRSKNGWCIYLDCIWWQAWRWTLFEVCSEILVYMLKHQIKWHLPFTSLPMANVQESIERNVKNGLIERTIHPLRPPLFRSSPKRWPSNSMMMIFCVFGISTC